eukprot:TRINITY_DN689_c0_g1_i7.p3 TRINITY_DN689_c0_g1~~TRINITY_DN689_c0_g1_i7.p3  ORF type:complete len:104 (+),score=29.96 TRINITY_DN689_c0_g1_i7:275-586(+)
MFSQRFASLLEDEGPSEEWTPFECCNLPKFFHLPVVFQQRSIFVGLVEFLPCLGSFVSHFSIESELSTSSVMIESELSTSRVIVFPVSVFTKICIPPRSLKTR